VLVRDNVASEFDKPNSALQHGYTYGGNPLGAAVALATLDFLVEDEVIEQVESKVQRVREGLEGIQHSSSIVGDIRNRGFMFGFELVADSATKQRFDEEHAVQHFLIAEGLRQGLLMVVGGSTINIMPPLTITPDEIDELLERLGRIVVATESRFAPANV
jgi:adenosylmethionine-8-amino-7-oxononanoate aminotransferase